MMRTILCLALLLLLPHVAPAQPGPFGGSVTFRLRTPGGAIVSFGRHDVSIAPRWDTLWSNRMRAEMPPGEYAQRQTWLRNSLRTGGGQVTYSAIPTPLGGNVPEGLHFQILFGADTMLLYFDAFATEDVDLGTIPLTPGSYRLPGWFPLVTGFQLDSSLRISPLDIRRFAVDSLGSLPGIVVRKIGDREIGSEVHRSEAAFDSTIRFRLQSGRAWGLDDWQLQRTLDDGKSWQTLLGGPGSPGGVRMKSIDIVSGGGTVVLWITRTRSSTNSPLVLRSDDTGTTWTLSEIEEVLPGLPGNERTYPFRIYDIAYDGQRFVAAGERIFGHQASQRSLPGLYELWFSPDRRSEAYRQLLQQSSQEVRQWIETWNGRAR